MAVQLPLTMYNHSTTVHTYMYWLVMGYIYRLYNYAELNIQQTHKASENRQTMDNLFTGNKQLPHRVSKHPTPQYPAICKDCTNTQCISNVCSYTPMNDHLILNGI